MDFDVVDLPTTTHPTPGDLAPSFTRPLVTTEGWTDTSLDTLLEAGPLTLVFHPMDGAFPTRYIWQAIADRDWDADCQLVGVSISTPYAHAQFLRDQGLTDYRLYSDPDAAVADDYGVSHDLDGMAGVTEHRPAVFVIDADKTVRAAWVAAEWPAFPPYDDLAATITDL